MPQFVPNGPIVPDRLVQDLEDDRVVIFCGAGISMGAGLPSFRGLVEHCYRELTHPLPKARSSDWDWPDRMLGALENNYSAEQVRRIVAARLSEAPSELDLHCAILKLARLRRLDGLRLVTTNFDTIFEEARKVIGHDYHWHSGPVLPIPRNDHAGTWRSLVYLHGRLEAAANQHLVLTSADFGRAYLTDAWAARFVSRLFADFTVLFIGYSLNDPVLRYMIDAFAAEDADARATQPRGQAYIFISYKGKAVPDPRPFRDRNLHPIFYHEMRKHIRLKKTLITWANWRADYLLNTAALINSIAPRRPDAINPTDTANLLWAVIGRPGDSGHGARVFAAVNSLPPIEWFDSFEGRERELQASHKEACVKAQMAERLAPPEPQLHIAPLFPDALDARELQLTPAGYALCRWLVRHLGTEGLVERVLARLAGGRRPHAQLRRMILQRLREDHGLRGGYVRFWRIVAAEGEWTGSNQRARLGPASVVRGSLDAEFDPAWLKQELLAALRPVLGLSPSFYRRWREAMEPEAAEEGIGDRLSQIADAKVDLSDRHQIATLIEAINARPGADTFWAGLLDELTSLLRQVLDLYAVADEANAVMDPSAMERPSIVPHAQNLHHGQWTKLFDLIWQGWTHVDAADAELSRFHVERWRRLPYLAFRRLVLAAMNHSTHFSAEERMEALLNG